MGQRESRLSRTIMNGLKTRGAFCFKVHGSEYMMAGLPDIVGCWEGRFFGIETKVPGKEDNVSKVQQLVHRKIRRAGGVVVVASSLRDALDQLETHWNRA